MTDTLESLQQKTRKYSDWSSTKGLRTNELPMRLFEKGKKLHWDPADIDFSQDAKDWESLPDQYKFMMSGLASGFMVGEEGVTLDIMPLVLAIGDEGRAEEAMYLTQFCYEEAKHVDFFNRWYQAIGVSPLEMRAKARENQKARGVDIGDPEQPDGLFEAVLPKVMRRVLTDRSPKAFLDCSITYNQFIEGCLAIAGYRMWAQMFDTFGVMPGLREGLQGVQADERRHIAYGTYLCRRILARHPDLEEWAVDRMYDLRDGYVQALGGTRQAENGDSPNGQKRRRLTGDELIAEARKRADEFQAAGGQAGGYGGAGGGDGEGEGDFFLFGQVMVKQTDRRIEILRKATKLDPDAAERGVGAEEVEEEIEKEAEAASAQA